MCPSNRRHQNLKTIKVSASQAKPEHANNCLSLKKFAGAGPSDLNVESSVEQASSAYPADSSSNELVAGGISFGDFCVPQGSLGLGIYNSDKSSDPIQLGDETTELLQSVLNEL